MNICGVLVHADPSRLAEVERAIRALPGAEIHAAAPGARFIVTLEDVEGAAAIDALAEIHKAPGVVAAALVYHHFEPAETAPADAN